MCPQGVDTGSFKMSKHTGHLNWLSVTEIFAWAIPVAGYPSGVVPAPPVDSILTDKDAFSIVVVKGRGQGTEIALP